MSDLHDGMDRDGRRARIIKIRKTLGSTQEAFAANLGMGLRAYSDIENGKSECRPIHIMAAEREVIRWAAMTGLVDALTDRLRSDVRLAAGYLTA